MSAHLASRETSDVYDIVGIGFGPANLSLAIAIREYNETVANPSLRLTARFIEKQPCFGWHRGMLLDGATMQISFLKDLATMRNPSTEFSFLNYLKAKDRLIDFINLKQFFPSRIEFHDYLEWAATQFSECVLYGAHVRSVRPAHDVSSGASFEVHADVSATRGPTSLVVQARNVVFGLGLEPKLPAGIVCSGNILHNQSLLSVLEGVPPTTRDRFIVVGAGQSAAETAEYLHRKFEKAEICGVFARFGYSPSDDSPFANRIFDPQAVDEFFQAKPDVRDTLLRYHRNTNYSVVDLDLIQALYDISYQELVQSKTRLKLFRASHVVSHEDSADGLLVAIRSVTTGAVCRLTAAKLIFATGYQPRSPSELLGELDRHCCKDANGRYLVDRDYRIRLDFETNAGLYLQGNTEHTHGLTSSLLSNLPIRSEEILQSVIARRRQATDIALSSSIRSPGRTHHVAS